MRTVTYIVLVAIINYINKDWCGNEYIGMYATNIVALIVIDVFEFVRGRNKR